MNNWVGLVFQHYLSYGNGSPYLKVYSLKGLQCMYFSVTKLIISAVRFINDIHDYGRDNKFNF